MKFEFHSMRIMKGCKEISERGRGDLEICLLGISR